MPRRGKANGRLAPMKEIIEKLQLTKQESSRLRHLSLNFLKETKKLQEDEIIRLSEHDFHPLAREFLQRETTPGKGPTGEQYWPMDGSRRPLTYASNPSVIIKLVGGLMRNQRKSLITARSKQVRQNRPNEEDK